MQLSPMGADKPRVSAGGAQQQQQAPGSAPSPPQEEDPPKIRVIVRKRPINRKVRSLALALALSPECAAEGFA